MATDIEQVTTALVEFDKVGSGLAQLQATYGGMLFDVETPSGMEIAKAARQTLRQPRYAIERIRKEAKAPLLAIGKKLDAEAARITTEIMKLEDPIDQQIKNEESRKEREREAAAAAEAARVTTQQARVDAIRSLPVRASGKPSAQIAAIQAEAAAIVIDGSYQEFGEQAGAALAQSVAALSGLHAGAVAAEAEAVRVAAEREELARLRAQQEERDRVERERLAEEGRAAREAQAAEVARQQAELNAQRAEQERVAQVERDRLAAERREQEQAIARERAELAAEQERIRVQREKDEAARIAALPKPATKRPKDDEIVAVLAAHYSVEPGTVRDWLRSFGMTKAA